VWFALPRARRGGGRGPLATALALCALGLCGCRALISAPPPLRTTPGYHPSTPYLSLPPSFEDRLLYYNAFEGSDGKPEINTGKIVQVGRIEAKTDGFRGRCGITGRGRALQLRSDAFSPHRPLSVSLWWALQEDAKIDDCFGLFHLSGKKGYVSHFSRGKGTWCALPRPAAILQVYYIPGIKNVNGIYDRDLMAHLELKAGVWHHTALVFNGASLVEVYTDGRRAWKVRVRGRPFRQSDQLHNLVIGTRGVPPMAIDDVLILRRALTAGEIADYFAAISQMREVAYPSR